MAAAIPIEERHVSAQGSASLDFSSALTNLGEANNNLGAIGASVAQRASNQMAEQLGFEAGKTPTGDLGPDLTDFDKNFKDSYEQQAHATLSTQGDKLLAATHLEISKANRLTPQLIDRNIQQLQMGLTKIADMAPTTIKGKLQEQFDSNVLDTHTKFTEKMIEQQRQEQKETLMNGIDVGVQNALELWRNGDKKGSDAAVQSVIKMAENAHANGFISVEAARVAKQTVEQANRNGQYIYLAMQALNQNKYAEFEKKFSETDAKTLGMTNQQKDATAEAFTKQATFIQSMRQQDENLKAQQMLNQIASNPQAITGTQWQAFTDSVTPLMAAKVQFKYIQALKSRKQDSLDDDLLQKNWSNPQVFANSKPESINRGFNKSVAYTLQQAQDKGAPISNEQAQVQVAAAAGGEVPVFTKQLKNELHSGNPATMQSAAMKIHELESLQAGHALIGLNDQDKALYTAFEAFSDSRDPTTAAHDATAAVLNQDPDVQKANKEKWSNMIRTATQGGLNPTSVVMKKFGMTQSSFINPSMAQVYGSDIMAKYQNFYQLLNGDDNSAQKLTQKYVDDNYGDTGVNGGSFKTLHPLEKVLGFQSSDGVPYIQQDVINQMTPKFVDLKKLYDDKKSDEYWEVQPLSNKTHGIFSTTYDPVKVTRHMRNGKTDSFPVVLQGNAFSNWDVSIQTDTGMRNLYQVAPYLGVISYVPDSKAIMDKYNAEHKLK